jgi:hypothetical protein
MVLILFDLDLKIYLNGLENKCKKRAYLLPGGLRPARARLLLPSLAVGLPEPSPTFFSSSRPRGPAQELQQCAPSLLCFADGRDP